MDKPRRERTHVEPMTVRLTVEDQERLKRLAAKKGLPIAILARLYIKAGMDAEERGKEKRDGGEEA